MTEFIRQARNILYNKFDTCYQNGEDSIDIIHKRVILNCNTRNECNIFLEFINCKTHCDLFELIILFQFLFNL